MSEGEQPDTLTWLVERRSEVQHLLLRLHHIGASPALEGTGRLAVFQLLLGVAFSLWRAVFLVNEARSTSNVQTTARQFLQLVIEDNAITYLNDKQKRVWSSGYYLNNALFRIRELGHDRLKNAGLPVPEGLEEIDRLTFEERVGIGEREIWVKAFSFTTAVCTALEVARE
jgi:hypothetical protein